MNRGQLPTNQLHDINWDALNHAFHAPQLMSCNYYNMYVCVCVCVCVCRVCVCMHAMLMSPILLGFIGLHLYWSSCST